MNEALTWPTSAAMHAETPGTGPIVNDIHAQLNATRVARIVTPQTVEEVRAVIAEARHSGLALSIAGGQHAMGGQQFATGAILLDTTKLDRVLEFDRVAGEIEVEAGIQWPALIAYLLDQQQGDAQQWGIIQKQTGADRMSLGGALAANVHGRGLRLRPIISDVSAFTLLDADGVTHRCDRQTNGELFRLAIGGYGLFGVIVAVRLKLAPRQKVRRAVELVDVEAVPELFARRIAEGYTYGDWQFSIDDRADDFLLGGICSCYHPVPNDTPIPNSQRVLSPEEWGQLLFFAHADKARAAAAYRAHYLATTGQLYWADTQQLADYTDGYHQLLDQHLGASAPATEMIAELYVPRLALPAFMAAAADDFRAHQVEPIYGTVRLIERDDESFLAWARESYACVIFNLHTVHTPEGIAHTTAAFRRLNDLAIAQGGSFYLTYGRFATRQQIETCYPQFSEFLRLKRRYDPDERFQSDWYRHYRDLFAAPVSR
jgi:FAD/FMN-containing dehydrogenase